MTAPKKKPSEPADEKPSDNVKSNIARQRRRSEGTREAGIFESARRAEVFATYRRFKTSELPISAPELARLAMEKKHREIVLLASERRRGSESSSKEKQASVEPPRPSTDLSEITNSDLDEMLQFIARCQWRIEATKHFWGGYAAAFYEEDCDDPEPTEVVKRIREEAEPIAFERSLILIGVPVRQQKKGESAHDARTRLFFEIFSDWFIEASKVSHVYGDVRGAVSFGHARPLSSWVPPTAKQIRDAYEERKKEGWPNRDILESLSRYVEDWRKKDRSQTNTDNAKRKTKRQAN